MFYYNIFQLFSSTQVIYDTDAQTFFTATGITDGTQKNAIDRYVRHLKGETLPGDSYSSWVDLWTTGKKTAIYLLFTGSATSTKYNLLNPLDTDGAFRASFNGGWTYSSTGATPATGYFDTHVLLGTDLATYDRHFSFAVSTHTTTVSYIGGVYDGSGLFGIQPYNASGNIVLGLNNLAAYGANANTIGYYIGSINGSSTDGTLYKDGSAIVTNVQTSSFPTGYNIYVGALNGIGSASNYEDRKIVTAQFGLKLTSAEADSDYNAWLVLKNDLGL